MYDGRFQRHRVGVVVLEVTVLHQGSMLCEGTVDEVQNDERVIEVYLGRKKKQK